MIQYNVRFFKPEEFKCPCCGQGSPAQMLVLWLDLFRAAWGYPVRINSGFRCEKHNKEVGGAEKSRHLIGCAADIAPIVTIIPRHPMPVFKAAAKQMFALPGWEVIEYPWGMHVAVPREEEERKWGGEPILL